MYVRKQFALLATRAFRLVGSIIGFGGPGAI